MQIFPTAAASSFLHRVYMYTYLLVTQIRINICSARECEEVF